MKRVLTASAVRPMSRSAIIIVALLYLSYVVSFGDRIIFGLTLKPVKGLLAITDTQLGFLAGAALALSYAFASPFAGLLVDRLRRKTLLIGAIVFWSGATATTGLVSTFSGFAASRAATGVGEAFLIPLAVSLISDSVERGRRGRAFSLYLSAGAVGSLLALLLGGVLVNATRGAGADVPGLGHVAAWRLVFLWGAAPGLVLALATGLLMREPTRMTGADLTEAELEDDPALFSRRYWPLITSTFVGLATMQLGGISWLTWSVTFMERVHHWTASRAAIWLACTTGVSTLIGCLGGGWLTDYLRARRAPSAPLWVGSISGIVFALFASVGVLASNPALALALLTVAAGFGYLPAVGVYGAMGDMLPPRARGWFAGLNTLAIGIVANSIGPLLVGLLNDRFFPGKGGLRGSLAVTFIGTAALGAVLMIPAFVQYPRRMIERDR